jgi:hypothetical protein
MRIGLVAAGIAFVTVNGAVYAASARACEQVSALVEEAVRPRLEKPDRPPAEAAGVTTQFRACLTTHNICSLVANGPPGSLAVVAAELTSELPAPASGPDGRSSPALMARSIPRVRNDSNQYCLILERAPRGSPGKPWDIYGWVMAPTTRHALPLKKQSVEGRSLSDSVSLRALAAELWLFAARMSGEPAPGERPPRTAAESSVHP